MKNCKEIVFLYEVIHPYGRVILVPHKKSLLQIPVSAVYLIFCNAIFRVGVSWFHIFKKTRIKSLFPLKAS